MRTLKLACLIAASVFATVGLGTPQASAAANRVGSSLPPPPIERMVEIDGRFVTVKISVTRVIPGNIPENWPGPAVNTSVQLSIQDARRCRRG